MLRYLYDSLRKELIKMSIFNNFPLVAAMFGIFISQLTKVPVYYFLNKRLDFNLIIATGGMPSSHSAGVTALISAIIIEYGWESPLTAITITFGLLVMFDSMGVRRQSGEHGIIINRLIAEIQSLTRPAAHPDKEKIPKASSSNHSMHSSEFLGHKPLEVILGALYGIFLALFIYFIFYA